MIFRFLEARLEEADARRTSFEKHARQIAQSTQNLRRSTSSDLQRCAFASLNDDTSIATHSRVLAAAQRRIAFIS